MITLIKKYGLLLLAVLFFVLIGTVVSLIDQNANQRAEIKRQEQNFSELGNENQFLILKTDELKELIGKENRRFKKTDSILKTRNLKISQLEKLKVNTVTIIDTDTVYLTNFDTLIVRVKKDTILYKTPFVDERNCIKIEGFVMSTDEFPSVAITSQHAEVETYEMEVKRRWYQFWKPKRWNETYTKCGDLKVLEVEKK
jgi:hypothetical protein